MSELFPSRLDAIARLIETRLDAFLSESMMSGDYPPPPRLLAAMRHAVLAGGKRIRPFLLIETARLFGRALADDQGDLLVAACAIECIHCYSLVHDDLPAMDNDAMRRGKPTVHRAYDEATAILAGDALQSLAFALLAREEADRDPMVRTALIRDLASASGASGMTGGQMLDLAAEGRFGGTPSPPAGEEAIRMLHDMKTAALLRVACAMGARLGRAEAEERERLARFGLLIGRAFQMTDDLLDATALPEKVGKATAKDAVRGKATFVALHGIDALADLRLQLIDEALTLLSPYGAKGALLSDTARFIIEREH